MATATLQDKLETKRNEIKATKNRNRSDFLTRYVELVRATAEGREVDVDEVVEVLDSLDLDADQLDKDAATMEKRDRLRQQLEERDSATERQRVVQGELAAKQAELSRIVREHRQAINALQAEDAALQSTLSAAQNSECRLRNQAPWWFADSDARLAERRQEVGQSKRTIKDRIRDEQRNLAKHEQLVANENSATNPFHVTEENRAFSREAAKRHRKTIKELEGQLTKLDKEAAAVEREAAELDREKLEG